MQHEDERDEAASEPSSDDPVIAMLRAMAHAPAIDPAAPALGPKVGERLAHFVVIERLGAGGMGVVYKAKDERLERLVALKVLSPRYVRDPDRRHLLMREARSAAAVMHPSIAAVYEVGEASGVAFIAMELVVGQTLRARLARGPLAIGAALDVACAVARGLARAHEAGVVHRDLKPDNVMIGDDGQVKILDFGLAKPLGAGSADAVEVVGSRARDASFASRAGAIAGTPAYMSPEQRAGEALGARSDVYSFGVLLHELLTGARPGARVTSRTTLEGAVVARDREDGAASRGRAAQVPAALEAIVARCLQRDPAARFDGGGALADALDEARRAIAIGRRGSVGTGRGTRLAVGAAVTLLAAMVVAAAVRSRGHGVVTATSVPAASAAPPPVMTLKRLTANPAANPIAHAAIAPDGRALAYVDHNGAYVERIGEPPAAPVRIAIPEGAQAELVAWMPASDLLLVSAQRAGSAKKALWLATPEGAVLRRVAEGDFTGLVVSPDGTRIAIAEEDRVGWIALDGWRRVDLVHKEPGCFITELAWSPDGARIAYASLCFSSLAQAAIESADAQTGAIQIAIADPRLAQESGVGGLVWTADGRLVYSMAEWFPAENGSNLWSLPIDSKTGKPSGPAEKLTSWASTLASVLSADRSGKRIAFMRFDFQVDVYVGDLEAGGRRLARPRRLTMTDRNERPSAWSADGKGVYFISDRLGLYDVFFQGLDETVARPIVAEPGAETGPQLSPDGTELLYWQLPKIERPEAVHPRLMRAPPSGGPAETVWTAPDTSYPEGAGRPQPWEMRFRCGRSLLARCVVSAKEGNALVFRSLDPHTGAGEELRRIAEPTAASFFWDLSPDGERIAMPTENGPVKIETVRGAPLGERRAPAGCDPIYVTWSADGAGLFVTAECSNAPVFRLYFLPNDGSAHELWDDSPDWVLGTETSPDGKHLAIAVKHSDNDVWLAERGP